MSAGQAEGIFQSRLPWTEADRRALPGIRPLDPADWLVVDDAFAAQTAERARLLDTRRDACVALLPEGRAAAEELLEAVLDFLDAGDLYTVQPAQVIRPDGVAVAIDRADPLGTLGLLVQEDLCLHLKPGGADEHVMVGAVLCFPSAWTLSQKIGRPLMRIHKPVAEYDEDIGQRVQRLFDGIGVGRPMWRFNWLPTGDFSLHRPLPEFADKVRWPGLPWLRSERQTLWRLPQTRAVVFGIHTYMVRWPQD